jgi:hypothetical protein
MTMEGETNTATMNSASASAFAAAAHAAAADDDDDDDSVVHVDSAAEKKKDGMTKILSGRQNTIQACASMDERRQLLEDIGKDNGKCFRPEFQAAKKLEIADLLAKIKSFANLSNAQKSKKWTGGIVGAQLYDFGMLLDKQSALPSSGKQRHAKDTSCNARTVAFIEIVFRSKTSKSKMIIC